VWRLDVRVTGALDRWTLRRHYADGAGRCVRCGLPWSCPRATDAADLAGHGAKVLRWTFREWLDMRFRTDPHRPRPPESGSADFRADRRRPPEPGSADRRADRDRRHPSESGSADFRADRDRLHPPESDTADLRADRRRRPPESGRADFRADRRRPSESGRVGEESDQSIWTRAVVFWLMMAATLVAAAWAAVAQVAPFGSRWYMAPVLGVIAYPFGVLAFVAAPWPDRLLSALKSSGQATLFSALVLWIGPDSAGTAVFVVATLVLALTFGMWRANKQVRATE
jgi:hypothetical protein